MGRATLEASLESVARGSAPAGLAEGACGAAPCWSRPRQIGTVFLRAHRGDLGRNDRNEPRWQQHFVSAWPPFTAFVRRGVADPSPSSKFKASLACWLLQAFYEVPQGSQAEFQ